MRYAMLLVLLAAATLNADDWTPPESPDPHTILQEAHADARSKRYEDALAKHVWFHEHALEVEPAMYGVRLSFALAYWHDLAQQYPPALKKLKEVRDAARLEALAGKNVHQSFHDMESINAQLGEQTSTMKVFETLDKEKPKAAERVFSLAESSLIRGKAYKLIGKYLSPEKDFDRICEGYRVDKELAANPQFGERHMDYANESFVNDSTTLVALLVVNDRKEEAEKIAASARKLYDDQSFQAALDRALKGVVPDPWP
ncbi:hypothetical protein [Rhodopirellula halodulae]|uniref:hypothetical protein n=1 Tax=Rhodopirellula halodulae TaxID=2894198 RepID=UPI001E4EF770|nr:hypothetical protein [Rhodopirellula sp. JC737]MCC9658527.1 hypothetical protein [Rhodopirellula sp. JC737]